jgi:metal-responsive CopG/Arc/MetJ family transcriptional regulator
MTERISVSLDDDVLEALHNHLEYGDNRSQFIEDAIVEKLEREVSDGPNLNRVAAKTADC